MLSNNKKDINLEGLEIFINELNNKENNNEILDDNQLSSLKNKFFNDDQIINFDEIET